MEQNVIILGGGISGLTLGWQLARAGIPVDILEAEQDIGGLAGTVKDNGYHMDVGPHSFFSDDEEIARLFLDLFSGRAQGRHRRVKLYYRGKYLDYPLTAESVLFQMGLLSGIKAALSFLRTQIAPHRSTTAPGEEENVEDWAIQNFGHHLYQTFFKPYTEQFWKMPCRELSSRVIPTHTKLSFMNTLRMLLLRHFKGSGSLIERERLLTYYPPTGFNEIPEKIAELFQASGGRLYRGCRVHAVDMTAQNPVVGFLDQGTARTMPGTLVVSTIPLNELVPMFRPRPPPEVLANAERVEYRALLVLGLVTARQNVLNGSWYIYCLGRPYNRVVELNQFSPLTSPAGENIITLEISCYRGGPEWQASKEALFETCIGSLEADGILRREDVKKLMLVRAPYAYPVYKVNYGRYLRSVTDHIRGYRTMRLLGRCGEFAYMDIDVCMRRAMDMAHDLLGTVLQKGAP